MADLSKDPHDKVRKLIEEFRDATLENIEKRSSYEGLAGISYHDVEQFIAFDTWLKLDKIEQFNDAAKRQQTEAYAHKATTGHNPTPGCCPGAPKPSGP